jgi:hypothetical protein
MHTAGLADCIKLIKNDDVQLTLIPLLLVLQLCLFEQVSNVLFRLSDEFIEHLRSIHNLRLSRIQNLANLPSN